VLLLLQFMPTAGLRNKKLKVIKIQMIFHL
jgi:hypothetical protein